jgi:hypothetical protein
MSELKLKVSFDNSNIELEGEGELVCTLFRELRDNGLGLLTTSKKIVSSTDRVANDEGYEQGNETDVEETISEEYHLPSLSNLVMTAPKLMESDWLLIYALYCTDNGTRTFTHTDLKKKYDETNRNTDARKKNFAANMKALVSGKLIEKLNGMDYKLTALGKEKAERLIRGDVGQGKMKAKTRSGQAAKRSVPSYKTIDLGLSDGERSDFRTYWSNHLHATNIDKAVLIAYWLKSKKGTDEVGADEVFTMLRTAEESASFNILSALKNGKNQKQYFTLGTRSGYYCINHIGEDHIKNNLEVKNG